MLGGQARREAIRESAISAGSFTERERSARSGERSGDRAVRVIEQQLSWALSDLKRDGLVENPERGIWRLTSAARRRNELHAMPYDEYVSTPEWLETRAAALERAGQACALDVTHTEGLEVRHRTRERLGAELPADLVVLCAACAELHREAEPPPRRIGSIPPPSHEPSPALTLVEDSGGDAAEQRRSRLLRRLRAS